MKLHKSSQVARNGGSTGGTFTPCTRAEERGQAVRLLVLAAILRLHLLAQLRSFRGNFPGPTPPPRGSCQAIWKDEGCFFSRWRGEGGGRMGRWGIMTFLRSVQCSFETKVTVKIPEMQCHEISRYSHCWLQPTSKPTRRPHGFKYLALHSTNKRGKFPSVHLFVHVSESPEGKSGEMMRHFPNY
jgi:hypothetical protein